MSVIAERLKLVRIERKFSRKELAQKSNISLSSLQYYESGQRSPTAEVIVRLCTQLDVSADYLLGLTDDPDIRK